MRRSRHRARQISLLIGLLSALLLIAADQAGRLDGLEGASLDLLFFLRGSRPAPQEITIVTWDEDSMNDLNTRYQDWPRTYHAKVIENLVAMGAKAIGFDILVSEASKKSSEDAAFEKALRLAKAKDVPVVLDAYLEKTQTGKYTRSTLIMPIDPFLDAGADFALVNFQPDPDGYVRRWKPTFFRRDSDDTFPTFPLFLLAASEKIPEDKIVEHQRYTTLGREKIPTEEGALLINYFGPSRTFQTVPYYQVYHYLKEGRYKEIKKWVQGKIVLVGIYTETLGRDVHFVPFSRFQVKEGGEINQRQAMPGIEIMANVMGTILKRDFLYPVPSSWKQLALLIFLPLAALFFHSLGFLFGVIVLIVFTALLFLSSVFSFVFWHRLIPFVPPVLGLVVTYGGITLYRGLTEEREKRRIRGIFQRYVTESVVNEVLENPEAQVLGGKKKECTIYFSDIRGFTSISESLSPEEVVQLLNEYFTAMHRVINKYLGTLDKYIGDAIMAIWGAPATHPDDVQNALFAALEMREEAAAMSARWAAEGKPVTFVIGAGVNTDEVVVGNIGSQERQDYTAIGDGVNLASRLEGLNKVYGTEIIVGEKTRERGKGFFFRPLDLVAVKGKKRGVRIYELMGRENGEKSVEEFVQKFTEGFEAYLRQDWENALTIFEDLHSQFPEDVPTQIYCERVSHFKENPPGPDWDGIARMTVK